MQRMFNLTKWRWMTDGEVMTFAGSGARLVKLEVNSPDKCRLFITHGGKTEFLAQVEGRDTIEFSIEGPFEVVAIGGELAFYTADGADWSVEPVDDQTFTRIVERKMRNPELELMMALANRNMEKRLEAAQRETERRLLQRINSNMGSPATVGAAVEGAGNGRAAGAGEAPAIDGGASGATGGADGTS